MKPRTLCFDKSELELPILLIGRECGSWPESRDGLVIGCIIDGIEKFSATGRSSVDVSSPTAFAALPEDVGW